MNKDSSAKFCALCGSSRLAPYFSLRGFFFFRCRSCALIQMVPAPHPEADHDDYTGYDLERQRRFIRLFWIPQYQNGLRLIQAFKTSGHLLDIGCGTGEFLEVATKEGFSVTGVEPSETGARIAGQNHRVIQGEFGDVQLTPASFDVVTLWSVLEHVGNPGTFLKRVHQLLKNDGIVALRIPTSQGLLPKLAYWLFRFSLGAVRYPVRVIYQLDWNYPHVFFYNKKNTSLLLRTSGFEVATVRQANSFDVKSLDLRMDYLPNDPAFRSFFKIVMFKIYHLSRIFGRQDEIILVARKAS